MAYAAPQITSAGLQISPYADILKDLLSQFTGIYGSTIYLGPDSADYQMLSVFAAKISDVFQAIQLAYNARSPLTAIGSDLDSVIKLNGLARGAAVNSTCPVILTGSAGAVILNGAVKDTNGNTWTLPGPVTIGPTGTVTVTATCSIPGPIAADPGTITGMATPAAGWTSVTNAVAATLGANTEADSALRARQAVSVALPSLTMLQATVAAIAATPGVTRIYVDENPTGATNANGNPPHSITAVVEGGTDLAVATAIYSKRGIGCLTNGTMSVQVVDPINGTTTPIGFDRPTYTPIFVTIQIHGLTGYTSDIVGRIQAAVVSYLNSLQIGESVTYSGVYGTALSVMPNLSLPTFSIRSLATGTSANPTGTTDISLAFNQVAKGIAANVSVTTV
jgi:uncharacterized phage protein gp47/JayE